MRSAALLIVGDEILSGEVQDENGPCALRVLTAAGVRVERLVVAPDRAEVIEGELRHLRAVADAVVVSGGIGPTHDDVTRPAVARALGLELEPHPEAEARIRAWYAERVTEAELAMASMPRGAQLLAGGRTGTFGFGVAGIFVLPGVPFLFRDLVEVLPARFLTRPVHRAELLTTRREGEIADHLTAVQRRRLDVAIGSYPVYRDGTWHVRVVLRADDPARLDEAVAELRAVLDGPRPPRPPGPGCDDGRRLGEDAARRGEWS